MITTRFTVLCEQDAPQYFVVEVHPTKQKMMQAMRRFERQYNAARRRLTYEASCYSYQLEHDGRLMPEIGRVFFHSENIHPAVLAHEFTHAAVTFCRRRRLNPMKSSKRANDAEERLATCVGWMMVQFYEKQSGRVFYVHGGRR